MNFSKRKVRKNLVLKYMLTPFFYLNKENSLNHLLHFYAKNQVLENLNY